jgi:putative iron-regulated protein
MKIAFRIRLSRTFAGPLPRLVALVGLLGASAGCSDNGDDTTDTAAQQAVVQSYAELVSANYAEALATAKSLDKAVDAFIAAPSDATLTKAKNAWLTSRDPYGLSEAYRFYQGPIDNDDTTDDIADGPEGLLNSWPLDEAYIDYVVGPKEVLSNGGIINMPDDFPTIDADALATANGATGEASISTGYHAVEFLLWGQDRNDYGPGERPYTDYVTGNDATAENPDRRAAYLAAVSHLIIENLETVNDAWQEGEANYRADFLAMPPREALGKMLLGMGSLSGAELSGERMDVAYVNRDQEDEHSCFSDNTLKDLENNATAIQNVLLGTYGDLDGPGVDDLVEAKNPALANELRQQIQEAIDNIKAVPAPFDQAILGEDDSEGREHVLAAIRSLQAFTLTLVKAADALDIDLKLDE